MTVTKRIVDNLNNESLDCDFFRIAFMDENKTFASILIAGYGCGANRYSL